MDCVGCGSAAVTERPERTARGYRRFRCRECGKGFNERSGSLLNHAQYPSDVIALVVLWRLRYRLTLRDLAEMFLQRGIVFSHEAVIPNLTDQNRYAQSRSPMDMIVQGCSTRRFQARQQWSTMSS